MFDPTSVICTDEQKEGEEERVMMHCDEGYFIAQKYNNCHKVPKEMEFDGL